MAETEISVMANQYLSKYIPTVAQMGSEATAWANLRSFAGRTINWQFTAKNIKTKLNGLFLQVDKH